ncbi:MAG: hypothetical protein V3R56_01405 [Xanthomonadales bacterium]
MVRELFRALFLAGIPVAVTSYLLIWWALKNQYFKDVSTLKDVEGHFKGLSKARSRQKKEEKRRRKKGESAVELETGQQEIHKMNLVHNKWLSFGGGFYGVVGLLTYAVVELGEIRDFITQFDGFLSLISDITLELFIGFFINSIVNFVVAIAWPAYWLSDIRSDYIWMWFVAAYAGYWAGIRFALHLGRL